MTTCDPLNVGNNIGDGASVLLLNSTETTISGSTFSRNVVTQFGGAVSVGGGNLAKNISPNLVSALQLAKEVGASIVGVVGRDGGYTREVADACVLIPTVNGDTITPHAEAFQAVVWHLLVSHPALKQVQTKWESTK